MFVARIALVTAASLGVDFAQSAAWLIAAREVQGVGTAILASSTLALLSTNFAEGHKRTLAVAYYGVVAGVGASLGLVLGGVFADWVSWRVGFFINLPIGSPRCSRRRDILPRCARAPVSSTLRARGAPRSA